MRREETTREIQRLAQLYKDYQDSCLNEAETCGYLIDGLLNVLGWDTNDPAIGRREHRIKTADSDVYADYSFFDRTYKPSERATARVRVFVEAKRVSQNLGVDAQGRCQDRQTKTWLEQVAFYGVLKGARWLILTNGHQLALFRPSQEGGSLYTQGQLVFRSLEEMLSRIDDLLLLSRESVWSERIEQVLRGQQSARYQIPTPQTRIRALFEANDLHVFFDDKAADFVIADHQAPIAPDPLFYQGVNASWRNILANQDVIRPKLMGEVFRAYYFNSNICIIRSESGQGKTTLMFRFAYEYRELFYVLDLRHLTLSDVRFCELGVRDLTELRKPVLILVDDVTRKQGWRNFLHAVANMRHVYVLATTREDEWSQTDVRGIESRIAFVFPGLDYETARLIYDGISSKGFRKTENSFWDVFSRSEKRLLEFVTLVTQGGHLKAILDAQVSSLSAQDPRLLVILRFASFFHTLGLSVDIETLEAASGIPKLVLTTLLDQLRGEFVSRVEDEAYEGLHELRSRIITDILHSRFFVFDDTLDVLLEYADIEQFETLIKNLPLLGEDVWDRPGLEKLFRRLEAINNPVRLVQCTRAFNESARRRLSDDISDLIRHTSKGLVELHPDQFVLALHRVFGGSFRWRRVSEIDRQILERITMESLVSKISQALPFDEDYDEKEWLEYEHLVEWSEVVGVVAVVRKEGFVGRIIRSLGEYGEYEFYSFVSRQTDFLGVLTLLEVAGETIPYCSEIVDAWLDLDWDAVFHNLSWDEQKMLVERITELEEVLSLDRSWHDLVLDSLVASLVGWDPPDAMLDLLDEMEAIDEGLAKELKEHPEVVTEYERIDEWRSREEGKVQSSGFYDVDELITLPAEDIANRLREMPPGMTVEVLERLETQSKIGATVKAIGVSGLENIGRACKSLHEVENLVFSVSRAGRAHLSDICQAMRIRDPDLIIAMAKMRRELEEETSDREAS